MRVTIEFEHDDPGYKALLHSQEMASVITGFDNYLRNLLKYHDENLTQEAYDALQEAREQLRRLVADEGIVWIWE